LPIDVRMTETMGRGVFAARAIGTGEVLAEFHTIRLPAAEVAAQRASRATLLNYWFEDDADGTALLVLGWLELVNHRIPPNCDRIWRTTPTGDVVAVVAVTDIAAADQLFIDYRFDPAAIEKPEWA
jgi:hypothetical protein